MTELDKDTWYEFVYNFTNRLNANYNVEECLKMFVEDYWAELDSLAYKDCKEEEEKEESLDVYFERKMKPMWDYVYTLQKQVNAIESRSTRKAGLSTDSKVYPNWNIQQTRCNVNGAVGSAGDGGSGLGFATSGYMQVVDEKYTPEQLDEWSKIRFDDPSVRR